MAIVRDLARSAVSTGRPNPTGNLFALLKPQHRHSSATSPRRDPLWRAIIRDAGLVPRFQRPRESCGDAESAHRSFDKPNRKSSSVGCGHMWTDTYAFQARPFYESMGFVVFGRLDGPAPTFPRFFLMKDVGKMSK